MSMRANCFSKVGLYSNNLDLSPSKTRHRVSVRRVSSVSGLRDDVDETPKNTKQHLILDRSLRGKVERASLPVKHGRALAEASEAGSEGTVTLSSQAKQMGGEGTPVKSKTPLGQTNTIDNKPEFVSMNSHSNSRDPVGEKGVKGFENMGTSHDHTDGKRTNMKKIVGHPHSQATCLKQLLLLQLDLIEQQQQQLQTKDKEIDELKSDRDTLLARIERMERRLQLSSKEPRDKRLFQPLERWVPDTEDFWESDVGDSPQTEASASGKVQKRKFNFLDNKMQRSRGKASRLTPKKLDTGEKSPCQHDLRNKETPEKTNTAKSSGQKEEKDKEEAEGPYMTTSEVYLCCCQQPPASPLLESPVKKEEEEVAIPSWRENIVDPLLEEDAVDIPENLDDNVFLKRHAKLELDEKRRKRWDIQRIREQRVLQRLQQRTEKKKVTVQETKPEVSSFYPDPESVEYIEVTPHLPVVAFGQPLPNLPAQNFELPWIEEKSKCRSENPKKQTPHRSCRK
ncbi:male-specific lethal 1-like 1 [Triplophysa rosa]|uniref:Male-specific lethal 1-like protein n=1 Tax=Triplophysa rosa TaxID=992332 RepID=A0A9W7WFA9_TRIRA|nr:male-specific lethal 1-like 1 [Triplophysa rosa]KAI7797055.1 putative male-specific lethal 1-like protein [Triplophysa rosa]